LGIVDEPAWSPAPRPGLPQQHSVKNLYHVLKATGMERLCNTGLHFHPPPPSPALRSSRYSDRSLTGRSAGRSRVGSGQGHPCSSCWEGTAHPRCRTAPETGCPSRRRGSGPDNRATNRQTTGIANRHHFRNGGGRSCSDRHASCPGDGGSGGKVGWLHAPLLDSAPPPPHTHTRVSNCTESASANNSASASGLPSRLEGCTRGGNPERPAT
jgi:hypothetical protein